MARKEGVDGYRRRKKPLVTNRKRFPEVKMKFGLPNKRNEGTPRGAKNR